MQIYDFFDTIPQIFEKSRNVILIFTKIQGIQSSFLPKKYLDDVLENGRARYTEVQKEEVRHSIYQMLDLIHKKDYFTIAKDVKKNRFRPYMMQFLKFANKADEELCAKIRQQNILVIDDVTTSGSTTNEILRTLRIINEDNYITIFSLIGRKDLMADV